MPKENESAVETPANEERRELLKRINRFAAVSAPAVVLLLAARSKPAKAQGVSTR